ncbi:hypothetical protein QE152_g32112 [Popillia japonica]|uniref:Uncharacterized protein n=1 Tax=Popillia japonica TaxID=7064 RepID=A0AAW1IZW4_POPJA
MYRRQLNINSPGKVIILCCMNSILHDVLAGAPCKALTASFWRRKTAFLFREHYVIVKDKLDQAGHIIHIQSANINKSY